MFALLGDDVTLPCSVPSIQSCSSVNWNMVEEFQSITGVVKAGEVTAPGGKALRLGLLKDCSLEITHLELTDARLYSCDTGTLNSSVSLQILEGKRLEAFLNDAKFKMILFILFCSYRELHSCGGHHRASLFPQYI